MYTLWLSAEQESGLRALIDEFAGMTRTDAFAPHVTLISGFSSANAAERAASGLVSGTSGLELAATGVSTSSEMFRAVAMELESTEALLSLREGAERECDVEASSYFPHLSLVYGALSEDLRGRLAERAREWLPRSIRFDRIEVVRTSGPVSDWKTVGRFPFERTRST